jgi:hypothetical protein
MATSSWDDDSDLDSDALPNLDQDAVAALHDSEGEAGDEEGLRDTFVLDDVEAHELGVDLDAVDGPEAELN